MAISSQSKQNIPEMLRKLHAVVKQERAEHEVELDPIERLPVLTITDEEAWHIEKLTKGFLITGKKIERFARRTDFENPHGIQRLRDIMKKMGIMHGLVRQDIAPGDSIRIGQPEIGRLEY